MDKISRLNPDMVQTSFGLMSLTPVQRITFNHHTGECCGIGAVVQCFYPQTFQKGAVSISALREESGLTSSYIGGFMAGWDAGEFEEANEQYAQGYEDGEASWKQVKEAGFVDA